MKNNKPDVAIIGGGPIGIHTAARLADAGLKVVVIEADATIGKPRWCTGLVSEDVFEKFGISSNSLQNRLSEARVISPFGSEMSFTNNKMKVCVIDRTSFDQELCKNAEEKGVKFLLNTTCQNIDIGPSEVKLSIESRGRKTEVRSQMCVLATGIRYGFHGKLGLGMPDHFLDSVQSEYFTKDVEHVEVYLGSFFAPKSFAWVVPVNQNSCRIGISTNSNSHEYLAKLLKSPYMKNRILKTTNPKLIKRPIPVGTIKKTFARRLLVVGDAAGQVKPISGGGIYYGLISSNIASEVIIEAFRRNSFDENFLSNYETNWKKRIGFELTIGLWLRNSFNNCTDEQIDSLVKLCNEPSILRIFKDYDYFNKHGKLFKALVKKPAFWSTIYKMYKILSGENNVNKVKIEDFVKEKKRRFKKHEDGNITHQGKGDT